jgi:hypothetical protein
MGALYPQEMCEETPRIGCVATGCVATASDDAQGSRGVDSGAVDLTDIAKLPPDAARDALRRSVLAFLEPGTTKN